MRRRLMPCLGSAAALLAGAVQAVAAVDTAGGAAQQQPAVAAGTMQMAQAEATAAFDIPAQPLSSAITAFVTQSGYQVSVDHSILGGLRSSMVNGRMTPEAALRRMLGGTGIAWTFADANSVVLTRAAGAGESGALQLDPITVAGAGGPPAQALIGNLPPAYAGGQVARGGQLGLLGNRDMLATPFNQTSYTAEKIENQQARTVKDVLIDDPSVQNVSVPFGVQGDNVKIRGFDLWSNGVSFGGMYDIVPSWSTMAEMAERVEVLKGPSAMLNGMKPTSNIGGTVNVTPKRAPDESLVRFTPSYVSRANLGGHIDVGHRFGREKAVGVRFNGVYRDGETAVIDNRDERGLALLGLDFRGETVRLSADLGYQHRTLEGTVPWALLAQGAPVIAPPDASSNYGPSWGSHRFSDLFGIVRGEVDLTPDVTAFAAFGAHELDRNFYGAPVIVGVDAAGDGTMITNRQAQYLSTRVGNAGVRTRFQTGPLDHELAVEGSVYDRNSGTVVTAGPSFATNIYHPAEIAPPDIAAPAPTKTNADILSGLAVADTISAFADRVQLTVGLRRQRVSAKGFDPATGAETTSYDESALTPTVALVVKPLGSLSLYGNYIQGLQQGEIVGTSYANAGEVFPPFKATQFEAGIKVDWGRFTTTASAFQITQPSLIDDTATNTQVLDGEQRNRGVELDLFGEPVDGVRLLGGAMYLDPILTKTQGGLNDGMVAPDTPKLQLRLSGEWDTPFLTGLTLTGRAMYTSAQYLDTNRPRRSFPGWKRFDVGARYSLPDAVSPTGKPIVLRFNVENVLDEDYWLTSGWRGAPRTFLVSTAFDF